MYYLEGTSMYCINCGKELREGATFCVYCGAKTIGNNLKQNEDKASGHIYQNTAPPPALTEKHGKKTGKLLWLIMGAIVLVGIGVGAVFLYRNTKGDEESFVENDLKLQENEAEVENEPVIEEQITEGGQGDVELLTAEESEDAYALFNITEGTVENYASALDANNYQYYNSGIANFRFFYPATLYSDVNYNEQETNSDYGTNVKTIEFTGSEGSKLTFTLLRYEGASIAEKSEEVYNKEKAELLDAADVVYGTYEDHGRIIVTGYTEDYSKLIYDLTNVDAEYVMQMKVVFPAYQGVRDRFQKDYVTECLYRLCGFSGSTANCRSYETYKAESIDLDVEIAKIQEWYYSSQDQLDNMDVVDTGEATVYMENGNVQKIVVFDGINGIDDTREYSFKDNRLYFAFVYNGDHEQRFYFVNNMLVRYIDEQSEIYDLEDADLYIDFAMELQNDAFQILNNILM